MNAPGVPRLAGVNFENGGYSAAEGRYSKLPLLGEVAAQVPDVDILFVQEAFAYDRDGAELAFEVERLLAPLASPAGMLRMFLTRSQLGPLHQLIAVRWPRIRPVRHYTPDSPGVYHDQVGCLDVQAEGWDRVLHLMSVQWPYFSGDARLIEAQRLARYAAADSILAGGFNSIWPGHPQVEPDWSRLPAHARHHKAVQVGDKPPERRWVADRRALAVMADAGLTSAGADAGDATPTVNDHIDAGQGAAIDHILLSPSLAAGHLPAEYRVWANQLGNQASDHRLISTAVRVPGSEVDR